MTPKNARTFQPVSPSETVPPANALVELPERLTYRFNDLPIVFGVSRRTLERERSAGRFPRPDLRMGKMPLWRPETIREWIERGGRS